ncbi:MAG TPA: hypothetical protein VHH88_03015 [Verrucomicrobiae bacterium]|nr:hypothetical protein [Verrucomicrobiae bacterium]
MAREQFGNFTASELYCPRCKVSQPVREHLLLVLPSGELHEFRCSNCGTSLGKRTITGIPAAKPSSARAPQTRRLLKV